MQEYRINYTLLIGLIVGAFVFVMFRRDLGAKHGEMERVR